jgi:hypothetical protein
MRVRREQAASPAYPSSVSNVCQCLGCGTLVPARMREQAASDKPVALAISLSVNLSSLGQQGGFRNRTAWPKTPSIY